MVGIPTLEGPTRRQSRPFLGRWGYRRWRGPPARPRRFVVTGGTSPRPLARGAAEPLLLAVVGYGEVWTFKRGATSSVVEALDSPCGFPPLPRFSSWGAAPPVLPLGDVCAACGSRTLEGWRSFPLTLTLSRQGRGHRLVGRGSRTFEGWQSFPLTLSRQGRGHTLGGRGSRTLEGWQSFPLTLTLSRQGRGHTLGGRGSRTLEGWRSFPLTAALSPRRGDTLGRGRALIRGGGRGACEPWRRRWRGGRGGWRPGLRVGPGPGLA